MIQILYPFSLLYRAGLEIFYFYHKMRGRKRYPVYTISVGNLSLGGTGKTPLVIWLADKLLERGKRVVVISRGWGRKSKGTLVLERGKERGALETGDEPFLIFKKLGGRVPVIVEKNRLKAAEIAKEKYQAEVLLLDDAHQYLRGIPDFSILIFSKRDILQMGRILPIGPFREPNKAVRRANLVIINKKTDANPMQFSVPFEIEKIFMRYRINYFMNSFGEKLTPGEVAKKKIIAFCGIADPRSFLAYLQDLGAVILYKKFFIDHHFYSEKEIESLLKKKEDLGAELILTTEKDIVRIRNPHSSIFFPSLELEFEGKTPLEFLSPHLV